MHHLSKEPLSAHAVRNLVLYGNLKVDTSLTQSESEASGTGVICAYHRIHIINADQTRQNQLAYKPVVQESANAIVTWCSMMPHCNIMPTTVTKYLFLQANHHQG